MSWKYESFNMKKKWKALRDRYQKTADVHYSSLVHIKDL